MTMHSIYNAVCRQAKRRMLPLLALCFCAAVATAQTLNIQGVIKEKTESGMDTLRTGGVVYLFTNVKSGEAAYNKIRKQRSEDEFTKSTSFAVEGATDQTEIDDVTGIWRMDAVNAGNMIIVVPDGKMPYKEVIRAGKTDYTYTLAGNGDRVIPGVEVKSTFKSRVKKLTPGPPWEDGDEIVWEIFSVLDRDYMKKVSRFMFVPNAYEFPIDTMLETYIPPAVYDTPEYASKQLRRKSFDYEVNDDLAPFVLYEKPEYAEPTPDSTLILNDSLFITKYYFTFKMPDRNKLYFYRAVRELEDYTHVYLSDSTKCSPLRKKPWRFLVTDFAVQYEPLTPDLYEPPKSAVRNEPRELALEFQVGQAILLDNEKNDSIKRDIEKDMQMYRNNLQQVTIGGSASPEGNLETNKSLARRRADYAISWLRSRYPGINIVSEEPKVYTWEDAANKLQGHGRKDLADIIREKFQSGAPINRTTLPEWEETINPVLSELRAMNCSYTIRLSSPLTAEQAVDAFLHDPDYKEGGPKTFSRGDYYHIYQACTDTAALERLTERIYRTEIKPHPGSRYNRFFGYVANRYVADLLRRGTIDKNTPKILDGFVDIDTLRFGHFDSREEGITSREPGAAVRQYKVNRSPHVANLALVHFRLQNYSRSDSLAGLLPEYPKYEAIRKIALLCARFIKHPDEARPGLEFAWNANALSRAVLAVELRGKLDDMELKPDSINTLLWSLPDDEPRKWYLLALTNVDTPIDPTKYLGSNAEEIKELEKRRQEMEDEAGLEGFNALMLSDEYNDLEDKINQLKSTVPEPQAKDSIPDFFAYLQRCFELDSNYYKMFYLADYDFDQKIIRGQETKPKPIDYKYNKKKESLYAQHFQDIYNLANNIPLGKPAKKNDEQGVDADSMKESESTDGLDNPDAPEADSPDATDPPAADNPEALGSTATTPETQI